MFAVSEPSILPRNTQLIVASLCSNYSTWSRSMTPPLPGNLKLEKSRFLYELQTHTSGASVYVIVLLPIANGREGQANLVDTFDWRECGIAWTLSLPTKQVDGPHWKTRAYLSMLPYGWIPEDGLDFFQQFVDNLKQKWLKLCDLAEEHLSKRVEWTRIGSSRGRATLTNHSVLINWIRREEVLSLCITSLKTLDSGLNSAAPYRVKFVVQGILLWNIPVATIKTRI